VRSRDLAEIEHLRHECLLKAKESPAYLINKKRIEVSAEIALKVVKKTVPSGGALLNFIGNASMHPVYGIPVLIVVLYGLYEFVGVLGAGVLVDFVQNVIFGHYINPMATKVVETLIPVPIIQELLVGEYGLVTVALTYAIAIILPITVTFFHRVRNPRDSGYLPRLAIMSNRSST